jgi:alkylhydroperoxidase family enzyme
MARLPYLSSDDLREEDRELLNSPVHIRRALVNNPAGMRAFSYVSKWIHGKVTLDARLREMAILQVGYVARSAYEFSHHVKIGRKYGVTDADIDAIILESRGLPSGLGPVEVAVLAAARHLTLHVKLPADIWEALDRQLGRQQAMDLVLIIGYYNHLVRVIAGFDIEVEPDYAPALARFAPYQGAEWE